MRCANAVFIETFSNVLNDLVTDAMCREQGMDGERLGNGIMILHGRWVFCMYVSSAGVSASQSLGRAI